MFVGAVNALRGAASRPFGRGAGKPQLIRHDVPAYEHAYPAGPYWSAASLSYTYVIMEKSQRSQP